jgi:hypothetical protein
MKVSKATLFALALLVFAYDAPASRNLLGLCGTGSGSWDAKNFECDFECDGKTYELDCERNESGVGCTVDGQEYKNVYFACKLPNGQVSLLLKFIAYLF